MAVKQRLRVLHDSDRVVRRRHLAQQLGTRGYRNRRHQPGLRSSHRTTLSRTTVGPIRDADIVHGAELALRERIHVDERAALGVVLELDCDQLEHEDVRDRQRRPVVRIVVAAAVPIRLDAARRARRRREGDLERHVDLVGRRGRGGQPVHVARPPGVPLARGELAHVGGRVVAALLLLARLDLREQRRPRARGRRRHDVRALLDAPVQPPHAQVRRRAAPARHGVAERQPGPERRRRAEHARQRQARAHAGVGEAAAQDDVGGAVGEVQGAGDGERGVGLEERLAGRGGEDGGGERVGGAAERGGGGGGEVAGDLDVEGDEALPDGFCFRCCGGVVVGGHVAGRVGDGPLHQLLDAGPLVPGRAAVAEGAGPCREQWFLRLGRGLLDLGCPHQGELDRSDVGLLGGLGDHFDVPGQGHAGSLVWVADDGERGLGNSEMHVSCWLCAALRKSFYIRCHDFGRSRLGSNGVVHGASDEVEHMPLKPNGLGWAGIVVFVAEAKESQNGCSGDPGRVGGAAGGYSKNLKQRRVVAGCIAV